MAHTRQIDRHHSTLIFVHIPKAAGTTMHQIIDRQYKRDEVYTIAGDRVQDSINEFISLPEESRRRVRCLKGHMPFGLHRWVPNEPVYFTILRDPVDRIVSEYYFVLNNPAHKFHSTLVSRNMSLLDYVDWLSEINDVNRQTRWISGLVAIDEITPPYSEQVPPDALAVAEENLRNAFAVAGVVEYFDEVLLLMRRLLGWRYIYYTKANVTKNRPSHSDIPPQVAEVIASRNELDVELYRFAKRNLEYRLREEGDGFKRELRLFRGLNRIYGGIAGTLRRLL